jgi:hypothetical protein
MNHTTSCVLRRSLCRTLICHGDSAAKLPVHFSVFFVAELRLRPVVADVTKRWKFAYSSFDVAIDAFCFKHQIEPKAIATYIAELRRCLTRGGFYMLFLATRDDGYYRQFPTAEQYAVGRIIVDGGNGIFSRLYDRKEIERLFSGFEVVHYAEKKATNEMHGRSYERSSAVWHMRRL